MNDNVRYIIAVIAFILIIIHFFKIDYKDKSWNKNGSSYLGIVSMIMIIISMLLSNK